MQISSSLLHIFNKDTQNQHFQYWTNDFCPETYSLFHFYFSFLLNVTLDNKIIQGSGAQLYNTPCVYLLCDHHLKSSLCPSPFIPLIPSPTSLNLLPLITTLLSLTMSSFSSFFFAQSLHPHPYPTPWQLSLLSNICIQFLKSET